MKKILLIDDDDIILTTFEHMLSNLNYKVTTIRDSRKGLQVALDEDFDLILTDCQMPYLSGIELIQKLKEIKKEINIYILTGALDEEQIKQIHSAGVTGIIEKPFNIKQIVALLD